MFQEIDELRLAARRPPNHQQMFEDVAHAASHESDAAGSASA
jgi:hypothetical protein